MCDGRSNPLHRENGNNEASCASLCRRTCNARPFARVHRDRRRLFILESSLPRAVGRGRRGKVVVGNDPRYNRTVTFDPFPFPDALPAQRPAADAPTRVRSGDLPLLFISCHLLAGPVCDHARIAMRSTAGDNKPRA